MTKKIIAIWAQDEKGVIGKEDRLPWHLPAELQHFKETTLNHAILMGRVTFDGMGRRLLPKRQTLILTRNSEEVIDGALVFQDVESVLAWYQSQEKNLYIIGGKQISHLEIRAPHQRLRHCFVSKSRFGVWEADDAPFHQKSLVPSRWHDSKLFP